MFTFYRTPEGEFGVVQCSHDGLHWGRRTQVGDCGDNTSFFYNPFRKKWIFSIRKGMPLFERYSRARRYYECDDFMEQAHWQQGDDVFWQRCDETDLRECEFGVRYILFSEYAYGDIVCSSNLRIPSFHNVNYSSCTQAI